MSNYPSRAEMLEKTRQQAAKTNLNRKDPDEFRPEKVKGDVKKSYYFYVLPDIQKGEKCKSSGTKDGNASEGSLNYYYQNGYHWIDNTKLECPRCHDNEECALCSLDFELMKGSDDKVYKSSVRSKYLASAHYAVNIYFLNFKDNPEELRGKVMWFNAPKTVFDKWDACITNDDPGSEETELKAFGIFYHPYEGSYPFKLHVANKGDFNSYEESKFLAGNFAPLSVKIENGKPVLDNEGNKVPDLDRIQEILDQRHYLPSKFQTRDQARIQKVVDKYTAKESGNDDAEVIEEEVVEEPKKPAMKRVVKEELLEETPPFVPTKTAEKVVEKTVEKVAEKKAPVVKKEETLDDEDDEELRALLDNVKKKSK